VHLQEALEVEVSDLLAILRAKELGELGVRHNAALEAGIKARVLLHIRRDELRHIRLRALGLGGQAHEGGKLIRDGAELQEGVVCTASLPRGLLLGRHIRGIDLAAALGVTGLALQGAGRLSHLE